MGVAAVATSLALCAAARCTAQAQETGKSQPVKAMAKEADPNDTRGHDFFLNGRRVGLREITVRQLLLLGYGVQKSQLAGLPNWAISTRWDVDGTPDAEGQPSLSQLQGMVRKLLAERFVLQLHHEQRQRTALALTAAQGSSKLTADTSDPDGWLQQRTREEDGRHVEELKNVSMAELAIILQYYVDLPIVDQTGLKGRYDFNLQWTLDDAQTVAPDAPSGLFTAIQEQLGLKLERVKEPTDVLVIDKVARPGAN
jgi:uncharacterized protein (TIGR03435 family)